MNKVKLGDCIELIIDNRGKTPPLAETGYELIETVSINGSNKYPDYSKITKFVSEETYNTWFRKGHPTSGDILISTVGMNIGDVVIMKSNRGSIAQNLIALRTNNKLNSDYLYYILTSKNIREKIRSLNIGSAQPSLKVPHLLNIEFYLPNIEKQSEISKILNELDEKIEINTQINQTLEQIAQTIFKSWFIDFDPVHAKANARASGQTLEQATQAAMAEISGKNTQELHRLQTANPEQYQQLWEIAEAFPSGFDEEGVPRGWEEKPLPELIDFLEGPGIRNWQYTEEEDGIKFINIRCIKNGDLSLETANKITREEAFGKYAHFQLKEDDIVISTSGTLGRFALVRNEHLPLCLNTSVIRFRPIENKSTLAFLLGLASNQLQYELEARASGSVQRNFGPTHLKQISVLLPDFYLLSLHNKYISTLFELRKSNLRENDLLMKTRDVLLPKLLSGEV
ncbi:restriction endonuclease subunit S [Glaesserella parasuis]|nr:restriction endonuclease subunit S [Glaesserella parasuis]MDO9760229.1 restriction endonuclease subunit S [Glaesserella parasuis]MDO9793265.1 restriction endonuclease subunit S [Glaesserella parasuis]